MTCQQSQNAAERADQWPVDASSLNMSSGFSDGSAAALAPPACVCSPAPDVSIKPQRSRGARAFHHLPRCFATRLINDSSAACADLHPLLVSQLRRRRDADHARRARHAGMLMNQNRRVGDVLHGPRVKNGVRGGNGEHQDTPTKPLTEPFGPPNGRQWRG